MVAIKEIELVTIIDMVTFQILPPVRQYNQVQRAIAIANNAHTRKLSLSLLRTHTIPMYIETIYKTVAMSFACSLNKLYHEIVVDVDAFVLLIQLTAH